MKLEKVIISCPFGNYLSFPGTTATLGTFTKERRGGIPLRLWRILSTVRYSRRMRSWINRLGLPNPGIDRGLHALDGSALSGRIISLYGFTREEWIYLLTRTKDAPLIELNLSCPNVDHDQLIQDILPAVEMRPESIIAKLPPVDWFRLAIPLYERGVRTFHLCNTVKTDGGGLSGKPLKQYSLWAIREFRQRWGDTVRLIGGGGITDTEDVYEYMEAGADHIALGSMLFNPFNYWKIPLFVENAYEYSR